MGSGGNRPLGGFAGDSAQEQDQRDRGRQRNPGVDPSTPGRRPFAAAPAASCVPAAERHDPAGAALGRQAVAHALCEFGAHLRFRQRAEFAIDAFELGVGGGENRVVPHALAQFGGAARGELAVEESRQLGAPFR